MTPQERTAYQMKYANKRRLDLIKALSPDGRCAACNECVGHEGLEVNHVNGISWDHNALAPHRRHARYWREYKSGVALNALCQPCNGSAGQVFRRRRREQNSATTTTQKEAA
jgi:5-methylcytosine-specific restriction endonuclease McrA